MNPTQLSHELRNGASDDLTRRRWIIGLSLVGAALSKAVLAYQTGIIKTLPDPPIPVFDSAKVDASDYAYKRLDTPDAAFMLVNYGITATLASAAGKDRAETHPWLPVALAAKTLGDAATAVKLGVEEWQTNKKLCFYCQMATVVSLASVVLALPEAAKAAKKLGGASS